MAVAQLRAAVRAGRGAVGAGGLRAARPPPSARPASPTARRARGGRTPRRGRRRARPAGSRRRGSTGFPHHVHFAMPGGTIAFGTSWDRFRPMADRPRIIVLEGDQTGQELLDQALRLLDAGRLRLSRRARALRPVAGEPPPHPERGRAGRGARDEGGGLRDQGRDDHARGRGRRRQPEQDPARGGRRQGDHQVRAPHPGRDSGRRRAPPGLGRADGGRGRVRRRRAPRRRQRRRGCVPHRARASLRLPRGRRVLVPHGRPHARAGVRRAEVDRQPGVRGDAEGGDGRGGRALRRTCRTRRS